MERPKRKERSDTPDQEAGPSKKKKLNDSEDEADQPSLRAPSPTSGSGTSSSKSTMSLTVEEELNAIDMVEGRVELEKNTGLRLLGICQTQH